MKVCLLKQFVRTTAMSALACAALGMQGRPAFAQPLAYAPHPERFFGTVDYQYATFLTTEPLHMISMALDSADEEKRGLMIEKLIVQPEIVQILNMGDQKPAQRRITLQGALNTWAHSYPSLGLQAGSYAAIEYTPETLRKLAHALIRFAYDFAGLPRPSSAKAIVEDTIFGANLADQSERIRQVTDTLTNGCSTRATALDNDPSTPTVFKWVRWALRTVPGAELVKEYAQGILGGGKTCESLAADVLDIVGPHHSPLRTAVRALGQLEGTSLYLARVFYTGGDPENSRMMRRLRKLNTLDRLDVSVDEAQAVSNALGGEVSSVALVRLMSLAAHNHGLELYLQKAALQLVEDSSRATALAAETLEALNHFYALLTEHRAARKASEPSDLLAAAARPYHYWGGALVACELVSRGYEPWVSTLVSGMLGKVYEGWTGSNGEGISDKAEDIGLHIRGAQQWVARCH